jgi:TorA maturation chaperone TorD
MNRKLPLLAGEPEPIDASVLAKADVLLLLAELLAPPEGGSALPEFSCAELSSLFARAGLHHPEQAATLLVSACEATEPLGRELLAGEYNRLFGPELVCSIHETAYIRRDKGAVLGDISGFYRAFGFTLNPEASERPDHLRTELEFLAMLELLVARAKAGADREGLQVSAGALTSFVADHFGEWVQVFVRTLAAHADLPLYRAVAEVLQLTLDMLGTDLGLSLGDENSVPIVHDDPGTPYECGLAEQELTS